MFAGELDESLLVGARLRIVHQRMAGSEVLRRVPRRRRPLHRLEEEPIRVDEQFRAAPPLPSAAIGTRVRRALSSIPIKRVTLSPWQQTASTRDSTTPGMSAIRSCRSPFDGGIGSPAFTFAAARIFSAVSVRSP